MSTLFIHSVALPILEQLIHHATEEIEKPHDESEVSVVVEGIRLVEVLITLAEEQTSKISICSLRFRARLSSVSVMSVSVSMCAFVYRGSPLICCSMQTETRSFSETV